jgi:hypothetical protein
VLGCHDSHVVVPSKHLDMLVQTRLDLVCQRSQSHQWSVQPDDQVGVLVLAGRHFCSFATRSVPVLLSWPCLQQQLRSSERLHDKKAIWEASDASVGAESCGHQLWSPYASQPFGRSLFWRSRHYGRRHLLSYLFNVIPFYFFWNAVADADR